MKFILKLYYSVLFFFMKLFNLLLNKVTIPKVAIMNKLSAGYNLKIIIASIKLGIIDDLEERLSIKQICDKRKYFPDKIVSILRALVHINIIKEKKGTYKLTKIGKLLSNKSHPSYRNFALMNNFWNECFDNLDLAISTGNSILPDNQNNLDFYEYLNNRPEILPLFQQQMKGLTLAMSNALLLDYNFSRYNKIIDIGGGDGTLLNAIKKKYQFINCTLLETKNNNNTQTSNNHLTKISGNFHNEIPGGFDLYILKSILHNWNDKNALKILKNCRKAMKPGARILIIDHILNENINRNHMFKIYSDLIMLQVFNGKERTLNEIKTLLDEAGIKFIKRHKPRMYVEYIEAGV